MARFDVYRLPGQATRYVVDVQSDILSHLGTRTVLPLFREGTVSRATLDLNPVFEFEDLRYVLFTQLILAVSVKELKRRHGSLIAFQDEINRALDILLTGF
jgi:toxin CcdB